VPIRGAYHYFRSEHSPANRTITFPWEKQADFFLSCVEDKDFDFYALDFEVNDICIDRCHEAEENWVTAKDNVDDDGRFTENAQQWMDYVRQESGKPLLIYTNEDLYRKWMNKWPLWIAQWRGTGPEATPDLSRIAAEDWKIWQYAVKEKGREYGASSKEIDLDVFNGTLEEMRQWLITLEKKGPNGPAEEVITLRDVIAATMEVAKDQGQDAGAWFRQAGIRDKVANNSEWDTPYDPKLIEGWQLSPREKRDQFLAEILGKLASKQGQAGGDGND
jgi:hypothetical protein